MLFAIHYEIKPGASTKANSAALMQVFGERGEAPGTVAHYVYPAGGGLVIAEQDDPVALYESVAAYGEWLAFDIRPMLKVDDAIPVIVAYLSS